MTLSYKNLVATGAVLALVGFRPSPALPDEIRPARSTAASHIEHIADIVRRVPGADLPFAPGLEAAQKTPVTLRFVNGTVLRSSEFGRDEVAGVTPDADGVVHRTTRGMQAVAVLWSDRAGENVAFHVEGARALVVDSLGGVAVLGANGVHLGRIHSPWAADETGRSLPTHYEVAGATLTQRIDTRGASFPVIADPHYTWGWVTGTVYFNRQETRDIAFASGGATVVAGFALPPPFDAIVAIHFAVISATAAIADNHGACLKVKSTGSYGIYRGDDGDGYCR